MGINAVNKTSKINNTEVQEINSSNIINELMNYDKVSEINTKNTEKNSVDNTQEEDKYNKKELKKSVDEINKYLVKDNTHAEYSVHEVFNRIMIKIVDDKTDRVVLEVPPKKIIDMAAKLCELAGVIVDKRA